MPLNDDTGVPGSPLVSVALCVHNGASYLREQIDSVLAQRDVAIEMIALDDASTDASMQLLRGYAARDPRIRCCGNPTNLGATASFERAMSMARGAFIAPCDQDDVWKPGKLARLLAAIGGADLAYCDSEYIDATGAPSGRHISDNIDMLSGSEPLTFLFANSVSGHAALVTRELFEAARPFPAGAYHDWWLALCAAGRGGVVYVPEVHVGFRRHAGASSTLGRDGKGRRPPSRHTAWIEQRHSIMAALARSGRPGQAQAQSLSMALNYARERGRTLLLLRELWRTRDALPGHASPVVNVVRWWLRFRRKLRGARREAPSPPTP